MIPGPLEPDGLAPPGQKVDKIAVDQALFGYAHGHELIETTTAFDGESRRRLDRLTDGSGAETLPGFDGYLSGFPLPDGRYVFTRTWRAVEAKRPGSVWTHAAIISRDALTKLGDPEPVLEILKNRPRLHSGSKPLKALRVSVVGESRVPIRKLDDWSALITALTSNDSTTVGLTCKKAGDGEAGVRALWSWLWPGVRSQFAFSFGATNRPSLERGRYFDLIGVPENLKVESNGLVIDPRAASQSGAAIWAEIAASTRGGLSQYVRFCGAESGKRTAAAVLTNVWTVATNERLDRDARQLALAEAIVESFPDPASMRRLKRSVFTENGRLPVDWDPESTLEILALPKVAGCVLAEDVELRPLVDRSINNPGALIHAYEALHTSASRHPAKLIETKTVLAQLPAVAEAAISRSASPLWLEGLVAASPRLTAKVLGGARAEERPRWAERFWSLSVEDQDKISSEYVVLGRAPRNKQDRIGLDPASTAGWLAAYGPTIAGGINWLATCHPSEKSRQSAMIDLAVAVTDDGFGSVPRPWIGAVHDRGLAQSGVRAVRTDRCSSAVAGVLLRLIDPEIGAANSGRLESWTKVLWTNIGGVGGAHLLRYAQRNEPPARSEFDLLIFAFVEAWQALAGRDSPTWDALGEFPAEVEYGREWDRAYRLSAGLASLAKGWRVAEPLFDFRDLVAAAYRIDPRAAQQLDDILSDRIPVPEVPPAQREETARRGPKSAWRQMADEVRSMLGF